MNFLAYLLGGISLGSIYALIALGYTMVYGIAKMLNFAHGDIIMVGGYVVFFAMSSSWCPTWLAIVFGIAACTVLGVVIEKIAYKPLRSMPSLTVLITAIGVSYFLQNAALLLFKSNTRTFKSVTENLPDLNLGGLVITSETIVTISVTVVLMIALTFFVNKTKMGKAMRAVSEDKEAAELMGISVNKTITLTFAIGSALAAVAGVLLCSNFHALSPYTGSMPGIKAFVAAVFGGIGSIPGAMVGGILLGVIENLSKGYISTQLSDAIVFLVLILVLLVKPTGIFGKKINKKV